jgi:hypothetical protein
MGELSKKRMTQALLAAYVMLVSSLAYNLLFDPEDGDDSFLRNVG